MKILIDENLPVNLRAELLDYEVFTVRFMNWNGVKNGALLKLAIENGFEVFLTSDKNLQFEQNYTKIEIAIVVLNVTLLKWSFIEALLPKLKLILPKVEKGNLYIIE